MTIAQVLAELKRVYGEVEGLQRSGYRYEDPLYRVAGYTPYLEDAMTGLGAAMSALREHLGVSEIRGPVNRPTRLRLRLGGKFVRLKLPDKVDRSREAVRLGRPTEEALLEKARANHVETPTPAVRMVITGVPEETVPPALEILRRNQQRFVVRRAEEDDYRVVVHPPKLFHPKES